ncbi:hypothetical protein [Acinetobacter zhairhuonensis]|uniref:hypothetical protein n=1 Tax=Acinetobacter sp. A7.4 TaxID=2919921 RepID=UPI001F4F6C88|nr:hypothetical protein [Acinetobacter sp. A7.4]MCJ8161980.1 hypothetical protein [Acinetobacter sp. A7.4]
MNYQHIEHVVAVELQQTIHQYYQAVRTDKAQFDPAFWLQRLSLLVPQFQSVCIYQSQFEFDIWLSCFMVCYQQSLLEMKIQYLPKPSESTFDQFIIILMQKLEKQFTSVNIREQLKQRDEIEAKQQEKEIERYHRVTQFVHEPIPVHFFCRYHPEVVSQISILEMAMHIKSFEKGLQRIFEQYGCIYSYRSIFRDAQQQQNVAVYSLAFNTKLMNQAGHEHLIVLLNQLWQQSSSGYGYPLEIDSMHAWQDRLIDPVSLLLRQVEGLSIEDMIQHKLSMVGENIEEVVIRPRRFKLTQGKANKGYVF